MNRLTIHPALAILIAILAVSTASIFIRYAQANAPSIVIAASRLSLATLALIPVFWRGHRNEVRSLVTSDLLLILLSGTFLAFHFATWITSLEFTSVASSVVLVTTTPLWVALLSPIVLKEPLTSGTVIGLLFALVGGVTVGISDSCSWNSGGLVCPSALEIFTNDTSWGNFLALSGAWMAAGYLLIGRSVRKKITLTGYVFLVYGMAALVLIVMVLVTGNRFYGYPDETYIWLLLLALIPQLIGHSTFNWALRHLSAAFVSVTLLGEPIGSVILAYFLLKETPNNLNLIGAILILTGIFIASRGEMRRNKTR